MRTVRRTIVFLLGVGWALPLAAEAHEKWFIDASPHPTAWAAALHPPEVIGVCVAIVLTIVAGLVWRALGRHNLIPGPEILGSGDESRMKFYAVVPLILGVHVALPLIVLAL